MKNKIITMDTAIITSSIYCLIACPKSIKTILTKKNLSPLPKKLAIINFQKFMFKMPLAIVNTLYGMGVKAEKKTASVPYLL